MWRRVWPGWSQQKGKRAEGDESKRQMSEGAAEGDRESGKEETVRLKHQGQMRKGKETRNDRGSGGPGEMGKQALSNLKGLLHPVCRQSFLNRAEGPRGKPLGIHHVMFDSHLKGRKGSTGTGACGTNQRQHFAGRSFPCLPQSFSVTSHNEVDIQARQQERRGRRPDALDWIH